MTNNTPSQQTSPLTLSKLASVGLLTSISAMSFISMPAQAIGNELVIDFMAPKQTNEVAFVPFAGDRLVSSIVMNDLNSTELKVTSRNLPEQVHSRNQLDNTLPVWQRLGIPYLVVGGTRSSGGGVVIEYEVIDISTGRVLGGRQTYTTSANPQSLRYAAHVVADRVYEIITGSVGDFSGRIAYIEETGVGDNKLSQLKVMDADGQNARPISEKIRGSIFSPAWSPNGRVLAYAVQMPKGLPVIYVQNVEGGSPQVVTPFKGVNLSPSFSPDGTSLLFSSSFEGNAEIYRIQLGSQQPEKLISLPSNEVQPSYAPDGRSFIFVSDKMGENRPQIYRYIFGSDSIDRLSRGGYAASPSFSPDGRQIAFLSGGNAAIMNLSGNVIANLGRTGIDEAPSFSPNGKRVVYATKHGTTGVINIRSLNGGEVIRKSTTGIVRSPVWSKRPH